MPFVIETFYWGGGGAGGRREIAAPLWSEGSPATDQFLTIGGSVILSGACPF